MGVYVALLRGINVGKSTRIGMADLAQVFSESGCSDVKTYVQSGNVVFRAPDKAIDALPDALATGILDRFGVKTWLILRDLEAMRAIVTSNPYTELNAPPTSIAVAFHRKPLDEFGFKFTDGIESIPDAFEHRGTETWLYLPNGFSKSRFSLKFFAKDLGDSTTRNWRTVTKVLEMMEALA